MTRDHFDQGRSDLVVFFYSLKWFHHRLTYHFLWVTVITDQFDVDMCVQRSCLSGLVLFRDQFYHGRSDKKNLVWNCLIRVAVIILIKNAVIRYFFLGSFILRPADQRLFSWYFCLLWCNHWQFTFTRGDQRSFWQEIIWFGFFGLNLFNHRFSHKFALGWCDRRWFWCGFVCSKITFVGDGVFRHSLPWIVEDRDSFGLGCCN